MAENLTSKKVIPIFNFARKRAKDKNIRYFIDINLTSWADALTLSAQGMAEAHTQGHASQAQTSLPQKSNLKWFIKPEATPSPPET